MSEQSKVRIGEEDVVADSQLKESRKWRPAAKVLRDGREIRRIESSEPPLFQSKKEADDWIIAYVTANVRIIQAGPLKPPS